MESELVLSQWLAALPQSSHVGIDEDGLTLRVFRNDRFTGEYFELGGLPEEVEHRKEEKSDWDVHWTKTYHASGVERVSAVTQKEAEDSLLDRIGDLEGSSQYDADADSADAVRVRPPFGEAAELIKVFYGEDTGLVSLLTGDLLALAEFGDTLGTPDRMLVVTLSDLEMEDLFGEEHSWSDVIPMLQKHYDWHSAYFPSHEVLKTYYPRTDEEK